MILLLILFMLAMILCLFLGTFYFSTMGYIRIYYILGSKQNIRPKIYYFLKLFI
jgi:hypothetical protein